MPLCELVPNLVVIRPADANETVVAWKIAVERRHAPTVLALTRQNVPTLDQTTFAPASGLEHGAYILADLGGGIPEVILMASGSEVGLIVDAGRQLARQSVKVRLVSFPSWELFAAESQEYRNSVLPVKIKAAWQSRRVSRWDGNAGLAKAAM